MSKTIGLLAALALLAGLAGLGGWSVGGVAGGADRTAQESMAPPDEQGRTCLERRCRRYRIDGGCDRRFNPLTYCARWSATPTPTPPPVRVTPTPTPASTPAAAPVVPGLTVDDSNQCVGARRYARVELTTASTRALVERDVLGDTYAGPYTGNDYEVIDGPGGISLSRMALQRDHVVAQRDAWDSGACRWEEDDWRAFGLDTNNLLLVAAVANNRKSDHGPADYTPPNTAFVCSWINLWVSVKRAYDLTIESDDARAVNASGCLVGPPLVLRPASSDSAICDLARRVGEVPSALGCRVTDQTAYIAGNYDVVFAGAGNDLRLCVLRVDWPAQEVTRLGDGQSCPRVLER